MLVIRFGFFFAASMALFTASWRESQLYYLSRLSCCSMRNAFRSLICIRFFSRFNVQYLVSLLLLIAIGPGTLNCAMAAG